MGYQVAGQCCRITVLLSDVGRHRWVVYKDLSWPLGQEATSICPDWHGMSCFYMLNVLLYALQIVLLSSLLLAAGWIHCLYDVPPSHVSPPLLVCM